MGRQDVRAEVPRTREGTSSGARARTRGRVGVASSPLLRRITSVALALGTLAALPAAAAAHVDGGCLVTGTSTSGGPIDLTTATVWHVRSADEISIPGSAPFDQTDASASAYVFGFAIPLSGGHSEAQRSVQSDSYAVSTLALLGRVFVIGGASSGPFHLCSGQVEIVIDDANPLLSVAGAGGLGLAILGVLGAAWALRRPTSSWRRLVGLVALGLLGGGTGLVLQHTSTTGAGSGLGPSAFVASVASPVQVSLDPAVLIQSALLSALLILLMPFPSELFNKTLEANLPEVRAALARIPLLNLIMRPQPARTEEPATAG